MSQIKQIDLSFIKLEYFKNELKEYLQFIFKLKLKIKAILLFGSVATGKTRDDDDHLSDIDLFIICDDLPEDYWERRELVFKLTKPVCSGKQALWRTSKEMEGYVKSKYYLILDAFDEEMVKIAKGHRKNLQELVKKVMDGKEPDIDMLPQEEKDYVKTIKVLLGHSLYFHSWLKL